MAIHVRIFMLLLLPLAYSSSYAQSTYSKLINLEQALHNSLTDMEVSDTAIYVSSYHLCQSDTNQFVYYTCTSLSAYDYAANVMQKALLSSVFPEGDNRLLLSDTNIFLTGHWHQYIEGRPTVLFQLNQQLTVDTSFEYPSQVFTSPNNDGIIEFEDAYYLYGDKLHDDENRGYGHIIKIDKETKTKRWEKLYARALRENDCKDLQPTRDSNLIYIHHFNDVAGAGGESGFQIVKIDTAGNVIDSFEFEDIGIADPRLLASKEGDIYFSSQDLPYPHTIPTNGRINKINSTLDTIAWSLQLPANPFIDAHRYRIYDFIQARNGDVVACGAVWEEGPDGPILTPNNHTWNGFITRVTQSGQLKWMHIYRHLNTHPNLPAEEHGEFMESGLSKIHETENGQFIAGGTANFNGSQSLELPFEENQSWIWLLTVDQDGCLEGEECTEVIVLDRIKVGIDAVRADDLFPTIYPNPAVDVFHISGCEDQNIPYEIYAPDGKKLQDGLTQSGKVEFQGHGFFIVKFYMDDRWITRKVLME